MNKYKTRAFISLDGYCPMHCSHCYTYELDNRMPARTTEELIGELELSEFDIVYLSQTYENFYKEEDGLSLCRKLYQKFGKDIYIITRSKLSEKCISALAEINESMRKDGHRLYVAVSVCANESYTFTEDSNVCPSPMERLDYLKRLHQKGVPAILVVRPLFPDQIIRVEECENLIKMAKGYIDAVISSGLIVTEGIMGKLGLEAENLKFLPDGDSDYLANLPKEKVRYLDVECELNELEAYCSEEDIPFYRHSMAALNSLAAE